MVLTERDKTPKIEDTGIKKSVLGFLGLDSLFKKSEMEEETKSVADIIQPKKVPLKTATTTKKVVQDSSSSQDLKVLGSDKTAKLFTIQNIKKHANSR